MSPWHPRACRICAPPPVDASSRARWRPSRARRGCARSDVVGAERAPAQADRRARRPVAARFASGLTGWTLLGPGAVTVKTGGPGGHYAALRDNTTMETPPLAIGRAQQVVLVTARAPVGSPLLRISALGADGEAHALGQLQPSASWDTFAFNAAGLSGQKVRLVLDPVMGRTDAVDLARVGESEQVAAGMTLVRGAARRAAGLPAGALLTASPGPFQLRTAAFSLASDAATISVWIRGIAGLRPSISLSAGGRTLGTAIAGKSWRAVRMPVAALRGRRVALSISSADATGLQLAYMGTVQRAPALRVRRFVPAAPGSPPGAPIGVVVSASRALEGVRVTLEQRRGAVWRRIGAALVKRPGPREADREAAAACDGAGRLRRQRGGRGGRLARAQPPGVIAHLDLDAFFAAVEQLDRPELRGKPVVVGGDPRSRGVVSTASYEARRFGIRSAMSAAEAYRRCPKAIFVRPDMERYRERSRTVWAVVESLVERVEQVGIDEGYLDLNGLVRSTSDARALLGALQAAVRDSTGLSCSLGCGTGKTVAKIASDHRKPGGIVVVPPGREAAFLAPLPLRALPGIGPRGEQRLLAAGIATIGDLARQDDSELAALAMGKVGRDLRERARGADPRPVVVEASDPVTIGEETTFGHDLLDPLAMAAELAPIAENVFARVERHGFAARTVTTKLRYDDFAIVTRSRTLTSPVASASALASLAVELLEKALADRRAPVRLLGVYVGKLAREAQLELPLE